MTDHCLRNSYWAGQTNTLRLPPRSLTRFSPLFSLSCTFPFALRRPGLLHLRVLFANTQRPCSHNSNIAHLVSSNLPFSLDFHTVPLSFIFVTNDMATTNLSSHLSCSFVVADVKAGLHPSVTFTFARCSRPCLFLQIMPATPCTSAPFALSDRSDLVCKKIHVHPRASITKYLLSPTQVHRAPLSNQRFW